jgi:hypothetical protein
MLLDRYPEVHHAQFYWAKFAIVVSNLPGIKQKPTGDSSEQYNSTVVIFYFHSSGPGDSLLLCLIPAVC